MLTKYTPGQQAVFTRNPNYWSTPAKADNLIIRYYAKSSTMKLAIQRGEIDMSYQSFTPTEITSLQKQKGLRVYSGAGGRIRYLVMNVTRPPANNIAVRRAVAYLMPRQAIAARVYHGQVKPLYSQVPAGYPGHIDAFADCTVGARTRRRRSGPQRRRVSRRRSRSRSGGRRRTTETPRPTSTQRSSAASRRTAIFTVTLQVDRVGCVQRGLRTAIQRLPARLVPGLSGLRELPRAVLPVGLFLCLRVQQPDDGSAHQEGARLEDASRADQGHQADPAAGGEGRADHPVLAAVDDRRRSQQRAWDSVARSTRRSSCGSGSCRSRRVGANLVCEGASQGAPSHSRQRYPSSMADGPVATG